MYCDDDCSDRSYLDRDATARPVLVLIAMRSAAVAWINPAGVTAASWSPTTMGPVASRTGMAVAVMTTATAMTMKMATTMTIIVDSDSQPSEAMDGALMQTMMATG